MSSNAAVTLDRASFGGHETFPFRYAWLRKAVHHVAEDAQLFQSDDAMVRLGVGKNMVRAIRHWSMAAGMVEEVPGTRGREVRTSTLGNLLFGPRGWDMFLEDPATLWVAHYEIASDPRHATTWYWVFNHLTQPEFTKGELVHWLEKLAQERNWPRVSPASLKRDVDVFIRTYVPARMSRTVPLEDTIDCPLVELGLLRELIGKQSYVMERGDHPTLPDAVFAYALARFLERRSDTTKSIPIHSIAFAPGSPGRVFALTEDALMRRLETMDRVTNGALAFRDTAGSRQLLIHKDLSPVMALATCFGRRGKAVQS